MTLDSAGLGLRIAGARQRTGLTQDELARSAGLERSTIAKIETGARRVTALELARVADATGERIEWFVEEPVPSIVSHRNMSDPGEPSPRIDGEINRVARAVEFTARHDHVLRDVLRGIPDFGEPTSLAEAEALASKARGLLGIDLDAPLHDLSAKLVTAGILTFVTDLGTESADAGSLLLRTGAVAVINGALHTGRRRLALAHEFGHALIADEYTVDWRVDGSTAESRERSLDRFARALLLPRAALTASWHKRVEAEGIRSAAVRIASDFRVDMSTLAQQLLDLGLIDAGAAAQVRTVRTGRADIVEYGLVVADELPTGELPQPYQAAVLRLFKSETVSADRALDLLLDTWDTGDLPPLTLRDESEIWQFVS
ncbi:ImmA/IrrE family metallo-endopeptidase [Pseudactinotalea sp. HY158]|uniref:helix-turn-helix domain-containing protein n=1 Tax=Pseudactinotalea sp. HY158 TaxID=2654547 RepID=UPI00129D0ED1|nr:XRE family transcriptional regulator [Pseudactinotalea sp. HY158]QGH70788.1 ImmA/IrrE family metallo-endopeptidase [Pseudactinotalea sp. HY158]